MVVRYFYATAYSLKAEGAKDLFSQEVNSHDGDRKVFVPSSSDMGEGLEFPPHLSEMLSSMYQDLDKGSVELYVLDLDSVQSLAQSSLLHTLSEKGVSVTFLAEGLELNEDTWSLLEKSVALALQRRKSYGFEVQENKPAVSGADLLSLSGAQQEALSAVEALNREGYLDDLTLNVIQTSFLKQGENPPQKAIRHALLQS